MVILSTEQQTSMTKPRKNRGNSKMSSRRLDRYLLPGSSRPTVPAQRTIVQWIKLPVVGSTSTAGVTAATSTPSIGLANNITALRGVYDEFRILAVRWRVSATVSGAGSTVFYVDENDTNAPTAQSASQKDGKLVANNHINPKSQFSQVFKCQNITDLQFLDLATQSNFTVATLKWYSDSNYGTTGTTSSWIVEPHLLCELRGPGGP